MTDLRKSMAHRINFYKVFPNMFPFGIMPCDIDGILGINDKFIVMEWKKTNECFSKGQLRMLKSLANQPNFSVILVIGEANPDNLWVDEVYRYTKKEDKFKVTGKGIEYLRELMKKWFDEAWGNKPIESKLPKEL